ncbi:unnamed protein product [Aphanomyces euteiches]|uniref:PI3K/PI4K catalytic domain-containing protein n=1 Tax=Aphanomyces euteiches TaxID=100861 RepID=A0A6G0XA33_9STRA|nr:hypothetical protein Ae201684_006989 [Aphanomyces euteiches]KAH9087260.1 hypothetical protein Ae201684P_000671 [Aphanomyces euteiches]KAH9133375.1 hypothetical protein AeRB84_020510 [Aphanomyces euteiches]
MAAISALNKSSSTTTTWLLSCKSGKRSMLAVANKAKKAAFALPRVLSVKQPTWWSVKARPAVDVPVVLSTPPTSSTPLRVGLASAIAFRQAITYAVTQHRATLELTPDGCGGVYMVQQRDDGRTLAIFKPRDEEYMAPQNPRGYRCPAAIVGETPHPAKMGFRVGDGAMREVAAYVLDAMYDHFSGVPTTHFASLPVPNGGVKEGSIQAFVTSESSAEDVGSLRFGVADVHKIAILDIRLFNTDRHAGNILLQPSKTSTYAMVPIDHGLCLPSIHHLDAACFEWLHWAQAKFPLSADALAHIAALDDVQDAVALRSLGMNEDAIATMRVCTRVLKQGVSSGFSLFDVGSVLQRDGAGLTPSKLELMVSAVLAKEANVSSDRFWKLMDVAIENLWEEADKCKGRSMSGL